MAENRITVEGTSYIFGDLKLDERVPCVRCGAADKLPDKRLLIVSGGGRTETFYCYQCWNRRGADFTWVGVNCLYAFTRGGLNGSNVLNDIIHRALGMPFNFLHLLDDGIFLCGNSVKCEQPDLF